MNVLFRKNRLITYSKEYDIKLSLQIQDVQTKLYSYSSSSLTNLKTSEIVNSLFNALNISDKKFNNIFNSTFTLFMNTTRFSNPRRILKVKSSVRFTKENYEKYKIIEKNIEALIYKSDILNIDKTIKITSYILQTLFIIFLSE